MDAHKDRDIPLATTKAEYDSVRHLTEFNGQENNATGFGNKITLRSVFGTLPDSASKPMIDLISDRDKKIEQLMNELSIEKKERNIMEGAYNSSLNRLRQSIKNQGDLSAAEAAAESKLVAREMELERLQKSSHSEQEKLIADIEEAIRQRDDSLLYMRELEQRLAAADTKTKERSLKILQLKEKYDRLKDRYRDVAEKSKKMENYMCSLPSSKELEEALEENNRLSREIAARVEQNNKLEEAVAAIRSEKEEFEKILTEKSALVIDLESEIKHLKSELSPVLHFTNDQASLVGKPMDFQIGVYKKIVADLEKEVEKQRQFAQLYQNQLCFQKKCTEDIRNELNAAISKRDADILALQTELDSRENENSRLSEDLRNLQSNNQDCLISIEDLKQQVRNYDSLASGDAGVLHEMLVEKMYRCVDKCKRLETALAHLIQAALPNKEICSAMANSIDITELLSTTVPVVVFENDLDTSSKLQALLKHSEVIGDSLETTHDNVISALATVQAEAFPW